jgi:hypothetical protein
MTFSVHEEFRLRCTLSLKRWPVSACRLKRSAAAMATLVSCRDSCKVVSCSSRDTPLHTEMEGKVR